MSNPNPNIETLQWKLNQVYRKATPKFFMKAVSNKMSLEGGETPRTISPWTLDVVLYVLLMLVVVAFVYIVMSYANDIKSS